MPSALLLPVLTCAVVLVLSGVAKLRAPASVDTAFTSLHVPAALDTPALRRLVPWAEVALGVALVVTWDAALAAVGVLVLALFAAYLGLVVRAVRRPEPADCGCFGAIGDSRVTRVTVWRNATLLLSAALVVAAGLRGLGLPGALDEPSTWAWVAAAALSATVAVLVTYRAPGSPSAAAAPDAGGDYVRAPIPPAAVLTADGELVLLGQESSRAALLLVFLNPGCGPCTRISPLVDGWTRDLAPVNVKAVVRGRPETLDTQLPHLRGHAWFDPFALARDAFGVGSPSAVLLGTDGQLAGGPVQGEDEIHAFVAEVAEHLREAQALVDEVSDAR